MGSILRAKLVVALLLIFLTLGLGDAEENQVSVYPGEDGRSNKWFLSCKGKMKKLVQQKCNRPTFRRLEQRSLSTPQSPPPPPIYDPIKYPRTPPQFPSSLSPPPPPPIYDPIKYPQTPPQFPPPLSPPPPHYWLSEPIYPPTHGPVRNPMPRPWPRPRPRPPHP